MRAIYKLGIKQDMLSMPELLWKAYIDFETEEGEREKARTLYERLVQINRHVKVWILYMTSEAEPIPMPRAVPRAMPEEAEDKEEEEEPIVKGDPVRVGQASERPTTTSRARFSSTRYVCAAFLSMWSCMADG